LSYTLSPATASDLLEMASAYGVHHNELLEILVLTGIHGNVHPAVIDFWTRYRSRISGPEIRGH